MQQSRFWTFLSVRDDGQMAFMALALADTGLVCPRIEESANFQLKCG